LNPRLEVPYKSLYGKTEGMFEPSEASFIFKNWFGGRHPSQIYSKTILPDRKDHMINTMGSLYGLTHQVILTKNAWNCFRIENLANVFLNSNFVWIRRDIVNSAFSDLKARQARGSLNNWNSATTANYKEIQKLPYWEQVVEQQYWYNKAIKKEVAIRSSIQVWYEDLINRLPETLEKIDKWFDWTFPDLELDFFNWKDKPVFENFKKSNENEDYLKIKTYVNKNLDRLEEFLY
jgi:hypothetical protein